MIAAAALLLSLASPAGPPPPATWLPPLLAYHGEVVGGPELLRVRVVAERLGLVSHLRALNVLLLSDDVQARAYACPGGWIAITRAALRRCDSGAKLAFVLAHEIAHLEAKHLEALHRRRSVALLLALSGEVPRGRVRETSWESWCDGRAEELMSAAGFPVEIVALAREALREAPEIT